ncbi:exodeoxyribonuclease VII large subunit [Xylocopilactobacillus apicola]|uniref:Exodeoxyribonuclease 7 large subunit n=1 Tax=Xylocopilactobacillus apicola TaxID=2932184 RepID=A0AAU9D0C7_9LACO|nr:exodeoxyribonuclease VII large subunit [Xylocopilactobacillus apicola]BDR58146.1 exodeoxyribonuclease 7 large subunit [Xylocopilactobacillus apicola]
MEQNQTNYDQFLSVSQITAYIGKKFSQDPYLDQVNIKGEITNFRERPNGHQYFSLKDDGAKIGVTLFRNIYQKINFKLKDGDMIACTGRINVYAPGGSYSLIVESLEPYGLGTLLVQLQERKEKLAKMGVFAPERKRPICRFPKRIAVITSPSGAVIRDIITTTKRRFPLVKLVLFPAVVQGDQAANSVLHQLKQANELGDFDTIIIARGGGSFEDLWPFNDEALTVAVAKSQIPVITSVGHETDTTLVDYAADLRAPTPTAAAELATPRRDELQQMLIQLRSALKQAELGYLANLTAKVRPLTQSYLFRRPEAFYQNQLISLDHLTELLRRSESQTINKNLNLLQSLTQRLKSFAPERLVRQLTLEREQQNNSMQRAMRTYLQNKKGEFANLSQNLVMLDPHQVLKRGYAIAENEEHKVIDSIKKTAVKQKVRLILSDGAIISTVNEIEGEENGHEKNS